MKTKEEKKAYMDAWLKTPKGIEYRKRNRKAKTEKLSAFMKASPKFNIRNFMLHQDKLAHQKRKVGALAERLPNHYRSNGRIQYL